MDGQDRDNLLSRLDENLRLLREELFDPTRGAIPRLETKLDGHILNHKAEKRAIRGAILGALGAIGAAIGSWLRG